MSTTPLENWAVDLADVTFIYPFVGSEFVMVLVAVVLWLLWHVWQCKSENQYFKDEVEKYAKRPAPTKTSTDVAAGGHPCEGALVAAPLLSWPRAAELPSGRHGLRLVTSNERRSTIPARDRRRDEAA